MKKALMIMVVLAAGCATLEPSVARCKNCYQNMIPVLNGKINQGAIMHFVDGECLGWWCNPSCCNEWQKRNKATGEVENK